jgi:RND family efflux transporter MFP subunit
MVRRELRLIPLLCAAVLAGCSPPAGPPDAPKLPDVEVARAEERDITNYEVFYGKTQGEKEVDVRARVTGYLDDILFKDGTEVQGPYLGPGYEGDVLFQIDKRPLQAELERAEANLAQAESHVQRLEYDYRRAQTLANNKSMSREEYDKAFGDLAEARAAVKAATAARNSARLNLEYSSVRAPISGRISRRMVDRGNLVKADDTILTRIVSLDPMYAYFDIDERTFHRVQRFLEGQGYSPGEKAAVRVDLGLSDERAGDAGEGPALDDGSFPFKGEIDFVDNRIDPDSGSLWVRGTFANPKPEQGPGPAHLIVQTLSAQGVAPATPPLGSIVQTLVAAKLAQSDAFALEQGPRPLTPGLFVRVRLPVSERHPAILIPEQALATDQGRKFVWVLDKEDHAWYRKVDFGAQHEDPKTHTHQRVIKTGIAAGERVIISGLQRVRVAPGKDYAVVNVLPDEAPPKTDGADPKTAPK